MKRILLGVVLVPVVFLLVVVVGLLVFIDPNDYKQEISAQVKSASGYELQLEGDLSWSFYPQLGIKTEQVSLSKGEPWPKLASIGGFGVGVQLLPLLQKNIQVDSLLLKDVILQLVVNEAGESNWSVGEKVKEDVETESSQQPSDGGDESKPLELPDLFVAKVSFENLHVHYQDAQSKADHQLLISSLTMVDVALDKPIDMNLAMEWKGADGLGVSLAMDSRIKVSKDLSVFELLTTVISGQAVGATPKPVPFELNLNAKLNNTESKADLTIEKLQVANLVANAKIGADSLNTSPAVAGELTVQKTQLLQLLNQLGMELPDFGDEKVLSQFSLNTKIEATDQNLKLNSIQIKLDQTSMLGWFTLNNFGDPHYGFDFNLDQINLDQYIPTSEESSASKESPQPQQGELTELIPVEVIRPLKVDGQLQLKKVTYQGIAATDLKIGVHANQGVVAVTPITLDLLGGKADAKVNLNVKKSLPKIEINGNVMNVEIEQLSKPFYDKTLASGKTNLKLDFSATGNDVDALLKQALGDVKFELVSGKLHGINLNKIVVDGLRSQLVDFTALYPNYQKHLPSQLQQDTDINELLAKASIKDGKLITPDLAFTSSSGGIKAQGSTDLLTQAFDYQFSVHLSEIDRNKYLKGVDWPIRCSAKLSDPVIDWCKLDNKKMNKILAGAARLAIKDKGVKELGEKVGLDVETQDELDQEVKQKLKREEDRAKRKLQEKLNKLFD